MNLFLRWGALLAAMYLSYSAEYHLALTCGFSAYTAPAFPLALDLFMIWSIRERRGVAASVLSVVSFNVAAHVPLSGHWLMAVTVAASVAPPLVVWAMHVQPSKRRSTIPADADTSAGRNGAHMPAERLPAVPDNWPDDDLWADFENAMSDVTPDVADSGPVTPDMVNSAVAALSAAGQRVTGRRYLSMAV